MARFEHDETKSHPAVVQFGVGTYYWCQCGKTKTVPYCDASHVGGGVEPLEFEITEPITTVICSCGLTTSPPYCSGAHVDIR